MKNITRLLTFVLVVVPAFTGGCGNRNHGGPTLESETPVTLAQLSEGTSHLPITHDLGSDADVHYIRGDDRQYFRLPRSEPVTDFPAFDNSDVPIGSIALFMMIRDGKLTAPVPHDLAAAGHIDQMEPCISHNQYRG